MIVWNDSERSTSGSRLSSTLAVSSVETNESLSLALGLGDGGGSVTMAMSVVTGIKRNKPIEESTKHEPIECFRLLQFPQFNSNFIEI
jgi:hypothetical protein